MSSLPPLVLVLILVLVLVRILVLVVELILVLVLVDTLRVSSWDTFRVGGPVTY